MTRSKLFLEKGEKLTPKQYLEDLKSVKYWQDLDKLFEAHEKSENQNLRESHVPSSVPVKPLSNRNVPTQQTSGSKKNIHGVQKNSEDNLQTGKRPTHEKIMFESMIRSPVNPKDKNNLFGPPAINTNGLDFGDTNKNGKNPSPRVQINKNDPNIQIIRKIRVFGNS